MTAGYERGLTEIADGVWAWVQPDGSSRCRDGLPGRSNVTNEPSVFVCSVEQVSVRSVVSAWGRY